MSDPAAPPGRPPARPDGARPGGDVGRDRPEAVAAARLSLRFGLLVVAGLLCLSLPLPWRVGGVVFVVLGLVVGVMALRAASRASAGAATVVVLSLGLVATALVLVLQVLLLAVWPVSAELDRCQASALTDRAQRACEAQFQDSLEDHLLPGR